MRVALGAREFARLENFCAVQNGKHENGGVQNRRARWKAQLDARRSWSSGGLVPAEDRWLEVTDDDAAFIRKFRAEPKKGGWQRAIMEIFGGATV